MKTFWNDLKGFKTYLVTFALILYAVSGWYVKMLTPDQAMGIILGALGLSSLRYGIKTELETLVENLTSTDVKVTETVVRKPLLTNNPTPTATPASDETAVATPKPGVVV